MKNRLRVGSKSGISLNITTLVKGTIVCVFFFNPFWVIGQDCTARLDEAKQLYADGHLYQIPQTLQDCLEEFTPEQQVEAYELLSVTYLYLDEPEKADTSYINLLWADFEYTPDSTKLVEIEFLSKRFTSTPIFTLYPLKIGTNVSFPRVINENGTYNINNSLEEYKPRWGIQIGGGGDWNINQNLSLGAEIWVNYNQFRTTNTYFDADRIELNESHLSLQVPLFVRYTKKFNRWYPFVLAGYSASLLIDSQTNPKYLEVTEIFDPATGNLDNSIENPDFGQSINLNPIRTNINQSVLLAIGTNYRLKYRYISLEVRYNMGLKNVLDAQNQFEIGEKGDFDDLREYYFRYGQVDNDFRLDNLSINFGYVYPLYKPRKIEKKSGRGFLSNLFNKQ